MNFLNPIDNLRRLGQIVCFQTILQIGCVAHPNAATGDLPTLGSAGTCAKRDLSARISGSSWPRRIGRIELTADLEALWTAIDQAHGEPYLYVERDDLRHQFVEVESTLVDLTELEFSGVVACLVTELRDTHTRVLPSAEYMDSLVARGRILPLKVNFVGDKLYVVASRFPNVAVGTQLLQVNSRSINDILAELSARVPSDGYAESGRRWLLAAQFDLLYHFYIAQPDSFLIRLQARGATEVVTVPAIGIADTLPRPDSMSSRLVQLRFLSDSSIALLSIATFDANEFEAAGRDYDAVLDTVFGKLTRAPVRDLIVDLRGNDGGRDSYGSHLLSHLMSQSFSYYRELTTRTNKVAFWRLTANLDSTFNARFKQGLVPLASGYFHLSESQHPNLRRQEPKPPIFAGKVWLLVDGGSNSTTSEFAAVTRSLCRAKIVGQETGGEYEGNRSGTFAIVVLPNSHVRVALPLLRYRLAVTPARVKGHGVPADISVSPTLEDILGRRDGTLDAAEAAIARDRQNHGLTGNLSC